MLDTHREPHMADHDPHGEVTLDLLDARREWADVRETGTGCWYCLMDLIMIWCDMNNSEWIGEGGVCNE